MSRRTFAAGAFVITAVAGASVWSERPVSSQAVESGLVLRAQTFATTPGGIARFEFVVSGVPEITPPPTTTTTTTTTTSTTTTTTTPVTGSTIPPISTGDQSAAPAPATTTPAATTTTTTTPPPSPGPKMTVQVRSHRAIATRAGVTAALSGEPGPVLDILEFDLDEVFSFDEATGERRLTIDVPVAAGVADVTELDLLQPGVHPVSIQVRSDRLLVATYTTLVDVIRTDGPGRGPFTFVVLASIPDTGPQPSSAQLADAAAEIERVVDLVDALEQPVTVALPPTYLRDVIDEDDDLREALTNALDGNDRLLVLPDQPLDPSSAIAAGLGDELARGVATGEVELARRFPATPSVRGAWIVDQNVTIDGATATRNLGIPLLVVPYDHYLEFDGNLGAFTDPTLMFNTTLSDESSMRVMVVDPITELLEPDANTSPIERAVHLMADVSALRYQFDPDRRSMILSTPTLGVPDAAVLRELAVLAAQHQDFEFETIGQLPNMTNSIFLDGDALALDLDPLPSLGLGGRVQQAQSVRLRAADIGSMLPVDDPRRGDWDARLRTALSTGLTAAQASTLVGAVDTEVARVRSHVVQPDPFPFTIAGTSAPIPLRVENSGPTALTIVVHAESDKLRFPQGDLERVLAPNQITNIDIPVEARSNGVFPVMVELRTPAGNLITQPVELTARVSTLTGLGRLFTVGALLVLLTWWLTYFRRRLLARREDGVDRAIGRHPTVAGVETSNEGTTRSGAPRAGVTDVGQ